MTKEVFENIARTYYIYYDEQVGLIKSCDSSLLDLIRRLLLFFNITVEKDKLVWNDCEFTRPLPKPLLSLKFSSKITPLKLKQVDENDINELLSQPKYAAEVCKLSPLFDTIGYVVENNGECNLHFVGSSTYEIWKKTIDWFDQMGDYNWKDPEGDWPDDYDFSKKIKWDWLQ